MKYKYVCTFTNNRGRNITNSTYIQKSDNKYCNNCREITLLKTVTKIYAKFWKNNKTGIKPNTKRIQERKRST